MLNNNAGFWKQGDGGEMLMDNLVLYLDGKVDESIIGTSAVTLWKDLSPFGNDFYQDDLSPNCPARKTPDGLTFSLAAESYMEGRSMGLERNNIQASTWFCVFKTNTIAPQQILYAVGYPGSNLHYMPIFRIGAGGILYFNLMTTGATAIGIYTPIQAGVTYMVMGIWSQPVMEMYINGDLIGTDAGATMQPGELVDERIGTRNNALQNYFDGEIKALGWYDKELNEIERKSVEIYLMNRFNI